MQFPVPRRVVTLTEGIITEGFMRFEGGRYALNPKPLNPSNPLKPEPSTLEWGGTPLFGTVPGTSKHTVPNVGLV